MAISLKKWTHPSNGSTRLYVNGISAPFGSKVWIQDGGKCGCLPKDFPEVVVCGDNLSRADKDSLINRVEDELGGLTSFAAVLQLAA